MTPALIVPDEQSWTVWGDDPARDSLMPVLDAGRAQHALVSEDLPEALAPAFRSALTVLPRGVHVESRKCPGPAGLRGAVGDASAYEGHTSHAHSVPPADGRIGHRRDGSLSGHEGSSTNGVHHEHDDGGGDADMMAITGDPSADGLVMERIEFSLGPLAGPLPGGVVGDLVLDGDVVADCRLRATLRRSVVRTTSAPEPPDMLAPRAWVAAIAGATDAENGVPLDAAAAWLRIASVELERAVSHAAWVRVLGRLLSWPVLVERATTAIGPLLTALDHLPIDGSLSETPAPCLGAVERGLRSAAAEMSRLHALCVTSRRLASRMSGRGVLSPSAIRTLGLRGPIARASGVSLDSRGDDPRYRELGFEPVVREGGDAHARALLRLDEATSAIALASAALRRAQTRASATEAVHAGGVSSVVEGPRGPLHAQRVAGTWQLTTPGAGPALAAAGHAAVGSEWASALVILVSFDLSPWMVGP